MSDYTPTATEIFGLYVAQARLLLDKNESTAYQEFNRWLNEVKARALEDATNDYLYQLDQETTRHAVKWWLRDRAQQIREEQ